MPVDRHGKGEDEEARRKQKMLNEFPRFPSATSIEELLYTPPSTGWSLPPPTHIADGNHRLAIALELKLDYVPVRFQYKFMKI